MIDVDVFVDSGVGCERSIIYSCEELFGLYGVSWCCGIVSDLKKLVVM